MLVLVADGSAVVAHTEQSETLRSSSRAGKSSS